MPWAISTVTLLFPKLFTSIYVVRTDSTKDSSHLSSLLSETNTQFFDAPSSKILFAQKSAHLPITSFSFPRDVFVIDYA